MSKRKMSLKKKKEKRETKDGRRKIRKSSIRKIERSKEKV